MLGCERQEIFAASVPTSSHGAQLRIHHLPLCNQRLPVALKIELAYRVCGYRAAVVVKQLADLLSDALQNVHSAACGVISGGGCRGRKPSRESWAEVVEIPVVSAGSTQARACAKVPALRTHTSTALDGLPFTAPGSALGNPLLPLAAAA
eukprot:CAMPEP_0181368146 /NCGR_PEP_ID=MMETSP1106-20121128/11894_1 /TAXON_ID=81844 /ORGANISM="Mantoniella antarctica, Strain SL-175" /LENGTH=149 /DNA_ID=CAMNT_0023484167 /DNA_START=12 /DNA_END=458 /DNA_ORIENTATION=+